MGTMMQWRRCFTERGYSSAQPDVSCLRRVQELRSEETNRLKGSDYEKLLSKNPGDKRGRDVIRQLLEGRITFLEELITWPTSDAGNVDAVTETPRQ
jgi:hypothetical protein